MSHHVQSFPPSKVAIERIFEKVMHRRMTWQERVYFHLMPRIKPVGQVRTSPNSRSLKSSGRRSRPLHH
jgi:hypothetical protein